MGYINNNPRQSSRDPGGGGGRSDGFFSGKPMANPRPFYWHSVRYYWLHKQLVGRVDEVKRLPRAQLLSRTELAALIKETHRAIF